VSGIRWTKPESDYLESMAGDLPFREIVSRYQRHATEQCWPVRTKAALRHRITRLGYSARVTTGQWTSMGGAAQILGCSHSRVEKWLSRARVAAILRPVRCGTFQYVSRKNWRRLAREMPHQFGGFDVERLYCLLEDRELAEAVARRYPLPRGDWRVRCVETGQVWPSQIQAARALNVSREAISSAIRRGQAVKVLGLSFEPLRDAGSAA